MSKKKTYGEVLKELRSFYDYTQQEIGDYLHITSQAYSNYEKNKRTPDTETLQKIAGFYGKTLDQLLQMQEINDKIAEASTYLEKSAVFRAVSEDGEAVLLTKKQAKLLNAILLLTPEQQDSCQQFIESFITQPKEK